MRELYGGEVVGSCAGEPPWVPQALRDSVLEDWTSWREGRHTEVRYAQVNEADLEAYPEYFEAGMFKAILVHLQGQQVQGFVLEDVPVDPNLEGSP